MNNVRDFPMKSNVDGAASEIVDSDMANARRLAERHGAGLRYTTERGWLVWDGRRWATDERNVLVQSLAKDVARSIYDEISAAADRPAMFRHARRSQSRQGVENMIVLARSEPGVLARISRAERRSHTDRPARATVGQQPGPGPLRACSRVQVERGQTAGDSGVPGGSTKSHGDRRASESG